MSKPKFNTLAERLQRGDETAGGQIFDYFSPQIYRFFFARTNHRETAQDLTQEVFLKVVRNIQSYAAEQGDFTPWFWRIAHNALIDFFRQKKSGYLEELDQEGENIADPSDRTVVNAELREVMNAVRTLPAEEQELFQLHFLADLSYTDIARITGKSEANLRVIIHRLKKKIIKHYD